MGHLIQLHGHCRDETRRLLPWFATGQLGAVERAMVDAHLGQCAACRGDLRAEQRLAPEVAGLDLDVERGWAALRARVAPPFADAEIGTTKTRSRGTWRAHMPWLIAAQFACVALLGGVLASERPALFHALGSAPARNVGNMIVMFRPDAREADVRLAVLRNSARIVGGPTEAGAYVLFVAEAARPAALAAMQRDPAVILAQPIDSR